MIISLLVLKQTKQKYDNENIPTWKLFSLITQIQDCLMGSNDILAQFLMDLPIGT